MEARVIRASFQQALRPKPRAPLASILALRPQRHYATPTFDSPARQDRGPPPANRSSRPFPNFASNRSGRSGRETREQPEEEDEEAVERASLAKLRLVPVSPSYFTALPLFTDDQLQLDSLLLKYQLLPTIAAADAPRVSWLNYNQYTQSNTEPIRKAQYARLLNTLHRLSHIHPAIIPTEVTEVLARYKRATQPHENKAKPLIIDQFGRARAVGRRKTSHAVVWLVEGEGEVRVNGRELTEMFPRLHDRESAIWALKATGRVGRYNVWAIVQGGGVTGQAEALTLGVARALLVHEPALKPALRRAGCVTRDRREVERKKPGKLKARKMPAWVKR